MDFAALVAPMSVERFMADHWDRQPVHLAAPATGRAPLLDWDRLNDLLQLAPHWTEGNVKIVLNSRSVPGEFWLDAVATGDGFVHRADPAKIELFLAMGATLVVDYLEQIAPELHVVTDMLAKRFAAASNANLYASFAGVQGFATHYDPHHVFALHCAGEKIWRIYGNRAEHPLVMFGPSGPDGQAAINAARGPLAAEVRMRPGDVLYLPRGTYHEALTEAGESLHVTFSAAPHSGRIVLKLLAEAALAEPEFRAFLPDGREDATALDERLGRLGARLAAIVAEPAFQTEIVDAQRKLAAKPARLDLPRRPALVSYARTEKPARIERDADNAWLVVSGERVALGLAFSAGAWAIARPAFSATELAARFPEAPDEDRASLIAAMERLGLIRRYEPEIG